MKKIQNQIIDSQIIIIEFDPKYTQGVKDVVFSAMKDIRPNYNPLTDSRRGDLDQIPKVYGGKGKFWVALDGEQVIGTVAVFENTPKKANVKRLFLLKQYRGKGFGKMLLLQALDHCRKQDFQEVTLITSSYAKDAQRLFHQNSFQKTDKIFDFDKSLIHYRLDLK